MNFWLGIICLFAGAYFIGRLSLVKQITALVETCFILVEAINGITEESSEKFKIDLVGLYPYITYRGEPIICFDNKGDLNVQRKFRE